MASFIKSLGLLVFITIFNPKTFSCTGIFIKSSFGVFAATNEDGNNPETRIWTIAGEKGSYGRLYFGYNDLSPQGGVNEKGLWFDAFGLPFKQTSAIKGETFAGDLQDKLMAECATVEDVKKLLKKYNRSQMSRYQWMFGDKEGNSIIIEADTIYSSSKNYQVVTNFRQSQYPEGKGYECLRFAEANNIISIRKIENLEGLKNILSATHSEGQDVTLYSYIADLSKGLIYVYHFHNFENVIVLDLKKEIAKGNHVLTIHDLFPRTVAAEVYDYKAKQDFENYKKSKLCKDFDFKNTNKYLGDYIIYEPDIMVNQIVTVSQFGNELKVQLNHQGFYDFIPTSYNTFSLVNYGGLDLNSFFEPENTEKCQNITLEGSGIKVKAKRN